MNYSEISDFEINQRVAVALGAKEHCRYEMGERSTVFYELNGDPIDVRKGFKGVMNCLFDPCNDPKSAWPIIVASRIAIVPYGENPSMAYSVKHGMISKYCRQDANPLRAAMIVYLMMQEQQHDR
ncbi:phage protein NinX family protein [Serratia fonticola]